MSTEGILTGITEADIAQYLAANPGFFERHAELLGAVQLSSPHGQRAVSLQERQVELLRERHRGLERRIVEMIRNGQDNEAIADRLHRWTLALLGAADDAALPQAALAALRHEFMVPQAALRLWGVAPQHEAAAFAQPVGQDVHSLAASLSQPYCGANSGFEAARWLADGPVASMAMIPLRDGQATFGLLVLGSPDPTRFGAAMGTEFLVRIGELAGAALRRLRAAPAA